MELDVAHDYRIPHSEFLTWDSYDRDKAIWHFLRERSRCSGCGTLPEEWDEKEGGHRHAYVAIEKRCNGCQRVQSKRDELSKKKPEHVRGVSIVLSPTDHG